MRVIHFSNKHITRLITVFKKSKKKVDDENEKLHTELNKLKKIEKKIKPFYHKKNKAN